MKSGKDSINNRLRWLLSLDTRLPAAILFATMQKDQAHLSNEPTPAAHTRLMWWGLVAISLIVGYADLWRGGETLAPILLVLGYCVLVPVAILKR